jgi:hypothetical protein
MIGQRYSLQFTDLSSAVALSSQEADKPLGASPTSTITTSTPPLVSMSASTPTPTTVMLVTSNGSGVAGSNATLTMRPTTNGIVSSAPSNTVVVLSGQFKILFACCAFLFHNHSVRGASALA